MRLFSTNTSLLAAPKVLLSILIIFRRLDVLLIVELIGLLSNHTSKC